MNLKRTSVDSIEIRRLGWMRRLAAGGGLVLALALSGADAQDPDPVGFFERNPGPAGARTSLDPFDPFAPGGYGSADVAASAVGKRGTPAVAALTAWDPSTVAPQPGLPGETY